MTKKRALVCGAGGFIGTHLVKRLKADGYWVRGADIKPPQFEPTEADSFVYVDLRKYHRCIAALDVQGGFHEVYQLAADMGGMGFISAAECEIMRNNSLINSNMIDAAVRVGVPKYFFSSSVCIYPAMLPGDEQLTEYDAYPANPDNEYGWEKLYAERMIQAYERKYGIIARIARFQNCYGPLGTWQGGREKAPAAICRKVAMTEDNGTIEIWGTGSAVRGYTYVDDIVDGIRVMMECKQAVLSPVNLGTDEQYTVNDLVATVAKVSGKNILTRSVPGPVGVPSRDFSKARAALLLGWSARWSLAGGIKKTYEWIADQIEQERQWEDYD